MLSHIKPIAGGRRYGCKEKGGREEEEVEVEMEMEVEVEMRRREKVKKKRVRREGGSKGVRRGRG